MPYAGSAVQPPWDARLARVLVTPLKDSWVTPNHLTTVRLGVGLAAAAAFLPGIYGWSNVAALLLVVSGQVRVESAAESVDAGSGELFRFDPAERHSVSSRAGARVLLTLSPWPGEGHYRGDARAGASASS